MSVTVLAPTPALPPVRRPSVWEKMFGNFKMGKSEDEHVDFVPMKPSSPRSSKNRLASVSTGVETAQISYTRNASVAMNGPIREVRSTSVPMLQPPSPFKTRSASIVSFRTRRPSRARQGSWWKSSTSGSDASSPVFDRKFSIFGSHNPDNEAEDVPTSFPTSRRPSYVPRNAASSFLKTTTPLSSEEKAEVIRRASVADMRSANSADADSTPIVAKSPARSFRRPSPLNFNNDSTAAYNMYSMAGVCEIQESPESDLISPRGATFSATSAPRSPTDTIMEVDVVDSAKPSPELFPVKASSHVAVTELVA